MRCHTNQPFPCLSWISLIKISCHVNGLRQSYAEWGHPLPNWGCHRAVPHGKRWPLEGSCHHSHPASSGAGTACPMPHLGTLHSSEQRGEGMEHTQSCEVPLGGAFGISSPSPLPQRPPRMGTHLKAQVAPNQVVPSREMAKLIQST